MHISLVKAALYGGILCAGLAVAFCIPHGAAEPSDVAEPPPGVPTGVELIGLGQQVRVGEVQKKYPFAALDAPPNDARRATLAPPILTAETKLRLTAFEFRFQEQVRRPRQFGELLNAAIPRERTEKDWTEGERAAMRQFTLQMLHQHDVDDFINSEGFGLIRIGPFPKLRYLDLPEAPPIEFARIEHESLSEEFGPEVELPRTPARIDDKARMPSRVRLADFHLDGQIHFVNPAGLGYRKHDSAEKRPLVAGFQSHQFRRLPELAPERSASAERPTQRWLVRRLELVSLLLHEEPAVYVTEHLPNMKTAKTAPTRPVDEFEADALRQLRMGDDLVTDATVNRIRMLGALRASKQCQTCHDVERGQLLGAFAYDLRRDPPVE